jgi:predicted transcriptional regulator
VASYHGRSQAFVAFQVRLTPDLKRRLEELSYESGMSQVSIISKALEYYLAHVPEIDADSAETEKKPGIQT